MDQKWNKYTHVCHTCDALIEYTSTRNVTDITCECGGYTGLLSVEDATILPINEKKGPEMETMTDTFMQEQINELKTKLANHQNCDYWKAENGRVQGQIIELINDSYENGNDSEDILTSLCQIVDYSPKKTIEFTATMRFTGSIEIDASEADEFDLSDILGDAYVDINHGDVVIDNYELYDAEEC